MFVYGDPEFEIGWRALWRDFLARLQRLNWGSLDELRRLLIQAGQIEQAVADLADGSELADFAEEVTQLAGRAFYAAYSEAADGFPRSMAGVAGEVQALRERCGGTAEWEEMLLRVKVPEGFEFYTLYPEQYCLAALRFAEWARGTERSALVVGIRSIGTGLSAAVCAALEAAGWSVERMTVRPQGDPFRRETELPGLGRRARAWALVVDEGPGASGSSVASVAAALEARGMDRVVFLPGHGGGPGPAASKEVRQCWERCPRFTAALGEVRWGGRTLEGILADRSAEIDERRVEVVGIEDLSGGTWRERVYADEGEWPGLCTSFERTKFLCWMGDGRTLVWKFGGLGAWLRGLETAEEKIRGLGRKELPVSQTVDFFHGFVASLWVEGRRLRREDFALPEVRSAAFDYLRRSAGPPLERRETEAASARLAEMLYWNVFKGMGEDWAKRAEVWREAAVRGWKGAEWPSYGDGRLAPHEWVRTPGGTILKTDWFGHETDHTLVGPQPWLWDFAGAAIEWGIGETELADQCGMCAGLEGAALREAIRFYVMAYAAFRMGQVRLAAELRPGDGKEKERLAQGGEFYERELRRRLEEGRAKNQPKG